MNNSFYIDGQHITTVRANGTRIEANAAIANGTVVIYTVPVGYELLLTEWFHSTSFGATGIGNLLIFDTTPAANYYLNRQPGFINTSLNTVKNVIPPHITPAGYSIRLVSNVALVDTYGGIIGYIYETA